MQVIAIRIVLAKCGRPQVTRMSQDVNFAIRLDFEAVDSKRTMIVVWDFLGRIGVWIAADDLSQFDSQADSDAYSQFRQVFDSDPVIVFAIPGYFKRTSLYS